MRKKASAVTRPHTRQLMYDMLRFGTAVSAPMRRGAAKLGRPTTLPFLLTTTAVSKDCMARFKSGRRCSFGAVSTLRNQSLLSVSITAIVANFKRL